MLGAKRVLFGLALVTTAALGCGDRAETRDIKSSTGNGGEGGAPSTSRPGGGGAGGESAGSGGAPQCNNESTVFAARELLFGEGNSGEWKAVGENIDGLVSTAQSKDLCKPNAGASPSTPYPDGDNGIDNS